MMKVAGAAPSAMEYSNAAGGKRQAGSGRLQAAAAQCFEARPFGDGEGSTSHTIEIRPM